MRAVNKYNDSSTMCALSFMCHRKVDQAVRSQQLVSPDQHVLLRSSHIPLLAPCVLSTNHLQGTRLQVHSPEATLESIFFCNRKELFLATIWQLPLAW